MNRNHLALFHAVAEAGSVSGGAQRLRISQPAVSKQIGELESALGVRLFDRLPRGVRLTDAGLVLADYARRITLMEDDAERAIEELRGLKRGRLTIGASTTVGAYLLPDALSRFHWKHPGIKLTLEIANTQVIQAALMDGRLEIGFTEGLIESDALESTVFHEDELVAIAPAAHRLLSKKGVTARELCSEPLIAREKGSGTRDVVEAALATRGIAVAPVMSLGSTEAIKRAVIAGTGVAIVSRLTISVELQARLLKIVPLKDLSINRPLHQQKLRGRSVSTPVKEFLRFVS
jgi:DNA-binding transcriptional LysR family regulator